MRPIPRRGEAQGRRPLGHNPRCAEGSCSDRARAHRRAGRPRVGPAADHATCAGSRRPRLLQEHVGRGRGRSELGQAAVRAQPRSVARPGVEREAAGDVRGAPRTGSLVSISHRGDRPWPSERHDLAGRHLPEGLRRSLADLGRDQSTGGPAHTRGNHAHRRPSARRRVVVRHPPYRARLEVGLLHQRIPAPLRAGGRPRGLRQPRRVAARACSGWAPASTPAPARHHEWRRRNRAGAGRRARARPGRLGTAAGDPPGDGPGERQLHRGADAEGARRRGRQGWHHGRRRRGREA